MKRQFQFDDTESLKLVGFGILVGALSGLFISGYRLLIKSIEGLLTWLSAYHQEIWLYPLLVLVLVVLALLVYRMIQFEPLSTGSGIPQVSGEIEGYFEQNPFKIMFVKIVGGGLSALSGMALGREGPSIQMGAMSGKMVSKFCRQNKTVERFLLTCGASAGLAAAFGAPLSGVLFALEEVHRHFSKQLIIVSLSAALTSDMVSKFIFGTGPVLNFVVEHNTIPLDHYGLLLLFGLILALFGWAYLKFSQVAADLNDALGILGPFKLVPYFLLPLVVLYLNPIGLGGGSFVFERLDAISSIWTLLGLFVLKFFFSILSSSSKVPGGIFFPILVLGAIIGAIFSQVFDPVHLNSYILLGMVGYLTATVRSPITSMVLIYEMSGNITYLLPLLIISLMNYVVLNFFNAQPIYEFLLERMLAKDGIKAQKALTRNFAIEEESPLVGKSLMEIAFPEHCIVTVIKRHRDDIIPNGRTVLQAGDRITFLLQDEEVKKALDQVLNKA